MEMAQEMTTVQVIFEILVNIPLDSNFFKLKISFEDRTLT